MSLDEKWFTEICSEYGTAFSLKIREKLHEEQTPFQKIEIYSTEHFGKLMVIDGYIMLSDRDNFIYHEMMSHPTLFTHPNPANVIIIGGGDCGTMREVLKHPGVQNVKQIEIDQRVTELSQQYFPVLCESNDDSRAELQFIDGIQWMANAEAASVDVIIIDSTDPVGPAKGLFTEVFYNDCLKVLSGSGILVQQSESPLLHQALLKSMREAMLAAGFNAVKTMNFPQCVYPSGWWSATMAGKQDKLASFRKQDAMSKEFKTSYYNAEIHKAALTQPAFFVELFS